MSVNRNRGDQVQIYADNVTANDNGSIRTTSSSDVATGSGQDVATGGGQSFSGTRVTENSSSSGGTGITISSNSGHGVEDVSSGDNAHGANPASAADDATQPIIDDIFDQHLASDPKNFSFSLDNNHMMVNNVRQPESVFQSFRKKYVLEKRDSYTYIHNGGSTTSSVHQHRGNSDVNQTNSITN
jgi:hypothetical protein